MGLPTGTVINPGEFLLVWSDAEPDETTPADLHANFRLDPDSGLVVLSRDAAGAAQILDYIRYHDVALIAPSDLTRMGNSPSGGCSTLPRHAARNNATVPLEPLFINEWMAANTSIVIDPADQKPDDWFELYNPNAHAIAWPASISTDDATNATKYTIPAGFSIPAGGFLLVWADEDGGQTSVNGDLHVNFKLSQGGELIRLYAPDLQLVDAITFGPQTNNVSQGRYPNGAAGLFPFMPCPRRAPPTSSPPSRPHPSRSSPSISSLRRTWR